MDEWNIIQLVIGLIFIFFMVFRTLSKIMSSKVLMKLFVKIRKNDLFLLSSYISDKLIFKLNEFLINSKTPEIDIIINTEGGDIFSALHIVDILKNSGKKINIFIPHYSMSAGTLISMAGNKIYMTENSSMGPIDPQIGIWWKGLFSKSSLDYVIKNKKGKAEDDTFAFRYIAGQYEKTIKNTLMRMKPDLSNKSMRFLTDGKIEHGYRVTPMVGKKLGLDNIDIITDKIILRLLYKMSKKRAIRYQYYKPPFWK
jgi:hypothetical protein